MLDFPEAISCGKDLDDARSMLASARVDVAELRWERGEPLPVPDPTVTDPDLEEPIHLHLQASTAVKVVRAGVVS